MAQEANASTQEEKPKKEGLFDGLSVAQVAAGALAACTSTLFASQIGIAGSIIGVAVGSIVSTVASQLYKQAISRSADKMANAVKTAGSKSALHGTSRNSQADACGNARLADDGQGEIHLEDVLDDGSAMDTSDVIAQARHQRLVKKRIQQGTIAVAIVTALLSIAASGLFIQVVTAGEGIGEKTAPIVSTDDEGQLHFFEKKSEDQDSSDKKDENAKNPSSSSAASSAGSTSGSQTTSGTGGVAGIGSGGDSEAAGSEGTDSSGSTSGNSGSGATTGSSSSSASEDGNSGNSSSSTGSGSNSSSSSGTGSSSSTGSGSGSSSSGSSSSSSSQDSNSNSSSQA